MKKCVIAILAVLLPPLAQAQQSSKAREEQRKWENQRHRENRQRREQNNKMVDGNIQSQRYQQSRPNTPLQPAAPEIQPAAAFAVARLSEALDTGSNGRLA